VIFKGKTQPFTEMADRLEGRPTQRMQYENVPGTTFKVEEQQTRTIEVRGAELVSTLREIYGLGRGNKNRRAVVSVPLPEEVDRGQMPPEDREQGT
jgi:hypothetical protein